MDHVEQATAAPGEKRQPIRGLTVDEQFTEIALNGRWRIEAIDSDRIVLVRG